MIEHLEDEVKYYSDRQEGKRIIISINLKCYKTAHVYDSHIYTKILVVDLTFED